MKTQLERIPLIRPDLPSLEAVEPHFREVLENGKVTNFGRYVTALEEEASKFLGVPAVTVSSGTVGLIFSLQAAGLQPGDEVILPSFSFTATAQAVCYAGGIPVFAEIGQDLTLCPDDLKRQLETHPKATAVLPVHTFGRPCQISRIRSLVDEAAKKRNRPLSVIYDAAHAFGSALGGRKIGSFGRAEVFSLSVTKALVSIEGGMVASSDEEMIRRIQKMRNYGIESNYNARWPGMNGKMSEFHAIIGLENLKQLEERLAVRRQKAAAYADLIEKKTCFRTVPPSSEMRQTHKDFVILVPPGMKNRRDEIMRYLDGRGIETRAYFFPPIHEQQYFEHQSESALPVTEELARRVITLPFFTEISEEQIRRVAEALSRAQEAVQ